MNQELHLSPAYGRDYKSAAAVKKDWEANKDFLVGNPGYRDYTNKEDCKDMKVVWIRYDRKMKMVKVPIT